MRRIRCGTFGLVLLLIATSCFADQLVDFSEKALPVLNSELDRIDQTLERVPRIYKGTAAPTTAPYRTGDIWIDTTNHKIYVSDGNDTSANWRVLN